MGKYPNKLKSYKVIQSDIGAGGFAAVHLAECENGKVALKVPKNSNESMTIEDGIVTEFKKEAKIWKKLCSKEVKGVVDLYSYGFDPFPWMAIEFMSGGTLKDRIGHMSNKEAISIICSILDSLHNAHHLGIIHRDIKPGNILFTRSGDVKISDWGLGKVLLDTSLTTTISYKGTVRYSAPEQFDSEEAVDWRTDIFQAGAVLYHLLSGKPPLPADLLKAMNRSTEGKIIDLGKLQPDLPKHISHAVMRSLRPKKSERWQDANSFKVALMDERFETNNIVEKEEEEVFVIKISKKKKMKQKKNKIICPQCNNEITKVNKSLKCTNCDKFFCRTCDSWINRRKKYKGIEIRVESPLCEKCYEKAVSREMKRIDIINKKPRKKIYSVKVRTDLAKAKKYFDEGNYKKVISTSNKILKKDPEIFEAQIYIGDSYWEMKDRSKSIIHYRNALDLTNGSSYIYKRIANYFLDRKEYNLAEKYIEDASLLHDKDSSVLVLKGDLYRERKQYDVAIKCYDKAIDRKQNYFDAWYKKGVTYLDQKKYRNAIRCFDGVLSLKPSHSKAWYKKGVCYEKLDFNQKAIESLRTSVEIDPEQPNAYYHLAMIFEKKKRHRTAMTYYKKVLKLNKNHLRSKKRLKDLKRRT